MLSAWTGGLFKPAAVKAQEAQQYRRERLELLRELKGVIQATIEFASYQSAAAAGGGAAEAADAADAAPGNEQRAAVNACELDERDHVIQDLVLWLERCLWHGLREQVRVSRKGADRRTVVTRETDVSIWNFVQGFAALGATPDADEGGRKANLNARLAASVMDVRDLLFVRSSTGKGRAWLRVALNEKILDAALLRLLADRATLESYYEPYALMRDEESGAILTSMLAGLNGLEIKMHTDVDWLDARALPLRRPSVLVALDGEEAARAPLAYPANAKAEEDATRERRELHALQAKLGASAPAIGAASASWASTLRDAVGRASNAIAASRGGGAEGTPAPPGSARGPAAAPAGAPAAAAAGAANGTGGAALDMAARSLHRRATAKRRKREEGMRRLQKSAAIFGAPLEAVASNPLTSALALLEPELAVPDLVLRCAAMLWTAVDSGLVGPEAAGGLFAVRASEDDLVHKQSLALKHALSQQGGSGLTIFARVGVDVDLQTAFASIAATTRAGLPPAWQQTQRQEAAQSLQQSKALAGLLRLFFRQLPESLVPFDTYEPLLMCNAIDDPAARTRNLACLVETFPLAHQATLRVLLEVLAKVAGDSEGTRVAVASAVAPAVVRPRLVGATAPAGREGGASGSDAGSASMSPVALGRFGEAADVLGLMIAEHEQVMRTTHERALEAASILSEKLARIRRVQDGLSRMVVVADGAADEAVLSRNRECLAQLWSALAPAAAGAGAEAGADAAREESLQLEAEGWKVRGFVTGSVTREFRGGGETALQDLTYFVRKHGKKARMMVAAARYPVVQAACQVSRMVADMLGIAEQDFASIGELAAQPWWRLLDEPDSTQRVFCMALLLLDLNFCESKATAMDFQRVAQETKLQMRDLLALEPQSVNQLWHSWIQLRAERMLWKSSAERRDHLDKTEELKGRSRGPSLGLSPSGAGPASRAAGSKAAGPAAESGETGESAPDGGTASRRGSLDSAGPPAVQFEQLLPRLKGESAVLEEQYVSKLETTLPQAYQGYDWTLVFSGGGDKRIGDLYAAAAPHACTLLLVRDKHGAVFGGFTANAWQVHPSYFGSDEAFLFTLAPELAAYPASGKNAYYMLANEDSLAMGGGGEFGLFLDEDLQGGTSGPCETFDSPSLSSEPDFDLTAVELWTFCVR